MNVLKYQRLMVKSEKVVQSIYSGLCITLKVPKAIVPILKSSKGIVVRNKWIPKLPLVSNDSKIFKRNKIEFDLFRVGSLVRK